MGAWLDFDTCPLGGEDEEWEWEGYCLYARYNFLGADTMQGYVLMIYAPIRVDTMQGFALKICRMSCDFMQRFVVIGTRYDLYSQRNLI